jgi:hypothetical protein
MTARSNGVLKGAVQALFALPPDGDADSGVERFGKAVAGSGSGPSGGPDPLAVIQTA